MEAAGVRGYIGLALPAVADPNDQPAIKGKVLRFMPRIAPQTRSSARPYERRSPKGRREAGTRRHLDRNARGAECVVLGNAPQHVATLTS